MNPIVYGHGVMGTIKEVPDTSSLVGDSIVTIVMMRLNPSGKVILVNVRPKLKYDVPLCDVTIHGITLHDVMMLHRCLLSIIVIILRIILLILPLKAVRNLQPMVCRIHFMDGKTKAISVEPSENVVDVLGKVQQKIDLQSADGWALYEVITDE